MSIAKEIGEKIRLLRMQNGIMQKELAEKLGYKQSFLSRIESGKTTVSLETLEKIMKIFNVGFSYFDDGEAKQDSAKLHQEVEKLKEEVENIKAQLQGISAK